MTGTVPSSLIILSFIVLSCAHQGGKERYERIEDGILIHLSNGENQGAKLLQLVAVTDDIIHVTASPVDSLVTENSLIVLPGRRSTATWEVSDGEDSVTLTTRNLQAVVSLLTGEVVFKDPTGNVILQEQRGGGKYFVEASLDGVPSYAIRQVFESPDDEAFYGLGGHQNGQMNYKGEEVDLIQHNIVDVVPFLYSSKNYGILWDNYSISKFGDPREYQSLSTLSLFDKNGIEGGLTGDYYAGDKVVKSSIEDKIEYEYLETPQVENFPVNVSREGKVIWEGYFSSDVEGVHKFLVYASGYFKVWIDDKLIMDKWRQNWNPWTNKFTTRIRKSGKHKIRIEWIPDGGTYMSVRHLDPLAPEEQNKLSLSSEAGNNIDYYFIRGDNADDVIRGYRHLSGKAPIAPKWAMGFWQSRERYRTQEEILGVVREYRRRNIPLDNIVLDWQYWEDPEWGSHEFDAARFPDPQAMVTRLHDDLHARLMISVWPKFNKGTDNYEAMKANGFLFTRNIDKGRKDWVGIGYESTFYDPFNKEGGELFWNQIDDQLNVLGIDAWWLDATEPDMHSNLSVEERKRNMSPTAMGPGAKYFNAYSLMNSRSVYEGQRRSSPGKRVFILTRSAYAGQQRFGAATWSGDIVARWSDFADQIAAGINFSLSGIPYWTMDIGGFAVEKRYEKATGKDLDEWRELNTRWFQFGAFCPVFRSHGQYPFREIYNLAPAGHEAYESMVYYDRLRYRLMPYIYSLAGHSYFDDYTIMRGLVMDFNEDPVVANISDQYMFGPALLINPVHQYKARHREVYLPSSSGWYDLGTGKFYPGGQTINCDAPYGRMPVFVKEGSILPTGPRMDYTAQKPADPITLYVYTGRDASFTIYEDEGINYNYEKGQYAHIPIYYDQGTHSLTIGERRGSFPGMPENRTFQIEWVAAAHPVGMSLVSGSSELIQYNGKPVTLKLF